MYICSRIHECVWECKINYCKYIYNVTDIRAVTYQRDRFVFQESLEERVQELEQALQAERIAAQRDRATITKLQRQINKVSGIIKRDLYFNWSGYYCRTSSHSIKRDQYSTWNIL